MAKIIVIINDTLIKPKRREYLRTQLIVRFNVYTRSEQLTRQFEKMLDSTESVVTNAKDVDWLKAIDLWV